MGVCCKLYCIVVAWIVLRTVQSLKQCFQLALVLLDHMPRQLVQRIRLRLAQLQSCEWVLRERVELTRPPPRRVSSERADKSSGPAREASPSGLT